MGLNHGPVTSDLAAEHDLFFRELAVHSDNESGEEANDPDKTPDKLYRAL